MHILQTGAVQYIFHPLLWIGSKVLYTWVPIQIQKQEYYPASIPEICTRPVYCGFSGFI